MCWQVSVDDTQHRHDGHVEEGEAGQLDLKGGADRRGGHWEQHAHCPVNHSSLPLQDVTHWAEVVLSVCRGETGVGRNEDRARHMSHERQEQKEERKLLVETQPSSLVPVSYPPPVFSSGVCYLRDSDPATRLQEVLHIAPTFGHGEFGLWADGGVRRGGAVYRTQQLTVWPIRTYHSWGGDMDAGHWPRPHMIG